MAVYIVHSIGNSPVHRYFVPCIKAVSRYIYTMILWEQPSIATFKYWCTRSRPWPLSWIRLYTYRGFAKRFEVPQSSLTPVLFWSSRARSAISSRFLLVSSSVAPSGAMSLSWDTFTISKQVKHIRSVFFQRLHCMCFCFTCSSKLTYRDHIFVVCLFVRLSVTLCVDLLQ